MVMHGSTWPPPPCDWHWIDFFGNFSNLRCCWMEKRSNLCPHLCGFSDDWRKNDGWAAVLCHYLAHRGWFGMTCLFLNFIECEQMKMRHACSECSLTDDTCTYNGECLLLMCQSTSSLRQQTVDTTSSCRSDCWLWVDLGIPFTQQDKYLQTSNENHSS